MRGSWSLGTGALSTLQQSARRVLTAPGCAPSVTEDHEHYWPEGIHVTLALAEQLAAERRQRVSRLGALRFAASVGPLTDGRLAASL